MPWQWRGRCAATGSGMYIATSIAVVSQSEKMQRILARVDKLARADTSVLLVGETGVGKELFADYIHHVSRRSDRPLGLTGRKAAIETRAP